MPRLAPWLFRRANKISPNVATLLPACRDLQSARNELRWIESHVRESLLARYDGESRVRQLCRRRGRGEPLQYVLGSQPFGPLDIKCRPGVLIPRPETESYTYHLAQRIKRGDMFGADGTFDNKRSLRILDFCTGTGCIPLLLFSLLQRRSQKLDILGFDISPAAVRLSGENIARNTRSGHLDPVKDGSRLQILQGDIFKDRDLRALEEEQWDVIVSNPPYISKDIWNHGKGQLGSSVRQFEPRLALVPNDTQPVPQGWAHEDVFYARLLDLVIKYRPAACLFEVGDEAQALRVVSQAIRGDIAGLDEIEVWRDWPESNAMNTKASSLRVLDVSSEAEVVVKGSGEVRAVFAQMKYTRP